MKCIYLNSTIRPDLGIVFKKGINDTNWNLWAYGELCGSGFTTPAVLDILHKVRANNDFTIRMDTK